MFGIPKKELAILKKLKTPKKIQDFINEIPMNFEEDGIDTSFPPMVVLEKRICHCVEGAVLAALALRVNGYPPLVMDLKADNNRDFDHVIAVFKQYGKWGAISKTNHVVLRYREPVYNSIRELAMSFFHEYYDRKGRKNLRSYSMPVNLKRFDKSGWMTTKEEIDYVPEILDEVKHYPMVNKKQIRNFRRADKIELETDKLLEWKTKVKGKSWY